MALISARGVSVGFGGPLLLEGLEFAIEPGERVSLVGRNGTGKTTLMKLLAGELEPDAGVITRRQGLRVSRLAQEVPGALQGSVFSVVTGGMGHEGELLADFHQAGMAVANGGSAAAMAALDQAHHGLEIAGGWNIQQRVDTVLSRMSLDPEIPFAALSGGVKRRVMLARALVVQPDLLLLDEPTNHLDLAAIQWLETFFKAYPGTLLFVTHDRMFLDRLATRILELDRGQITHWPGDYATYRRRKEAALEAEASQNAEFDRMLAREEIWLRQGIKARRTRNEGRVRALQRMRDLRRSRRDNMGQIRLRLESGDSTGKQVITVEGVDFDYDGKPTIRNFSTVIQRGDKVGIMGPNGCGKTTLLHILLGNLAPAKGKVRLGTNLKVAYFDQLRATLEEEKTVAENVGQGQQQITVAGKQRHIISYLGDFLFSPERARTPVRVLSGGERNRLLLARLFLKPTNVLVLDEPTNDLDMETLELLESMLVAYDGTLLLVSHDRVFLNRVVTSVLVFEAEGAIGEYVGGYDDWLLQKPTKVPKEPPPPATPVKRPPHQRQKKLTFKEQRELEALPNHIEALEAEREQLFAAMAGPAFYQQDGAAIAQAKRRLQQLDEGLSDAYDRWQALEVLVS